jgi:DNA (cytosine-5)-methyltransferase 1
MMKAMKIRGCETVGNFFSGSGAWELAAKIVGMKPVYESEIEPFPVKLEAKRFPECIQLGDITKVNGADLPYVDVLTNSSPCQNLSNAGNRLGLKGDQSALFSDAIRITRELRDAGKLPKWWCWENVPGALSCSQGRDFRLVLHQIAKIIQEDAFIPEPPKGKWNTAGIVDGDGWELAWRVMDAQFYGVPQRRRRLFIVASFGDYSAGEVLLERESVSWHFAEIASAWEDTERDLGDRISLAKQVVMADVRGAEAGVGQGAVNEREQ